MSRLPAGPNLTVAAYERLRADVLACRLKPGQRLKINDLCAGLSVSLGAIREALSRLTAEGLMVASPQRGFSVAPISRADLEDLTSTRIELEQSCLRRAIARGNLAWESRLVASLHELSETPERVVGDQARLNEDWVRAHGAFHAALVAACDSPWRLRLRTQLYAQAERYRRLSVPLARSVRNLRDEHRLLAEAALARAADLAARLMAEHLQRTVTILTIEAELPDGAAQGWHPADRELVAHDAAE